MVESSGKDDQALLSLADVLSISGVTKLVLHAWERRYGIEPARRGGSGRRFFTEDQAERLRLLKVCSDGGDRIGTLVTLPLQDLQRIETCLRARQRNAPLIAALKALDSEEFRSLLQERAEAEGPEAFIQATVLPLLRDIGTLWSQGSLSIAAEHLATTKIMRMLGTMVDECPRAEATAPRMITATLTGEAHEIGALAATLIARLDGWNSLFLGPNLPPDEIAAAAITRQARCVCLSSTAGKPARLEESLRHLRDALPDEVLLVTGGPGYAALPALKGVDFLPDLHAFRSLIETIR